MLPLKKIRVLIVDDSILFRKTLELRLSQNPAVEVVGTAMDAEDALGKIQALSPDVVTMDVEMPKMNGIDFIKKLIPIHPVPVIVVSSLPLNVLDALEAGAVDFVEKPNAQNGTGLDQFVFHLAVKIRIATSAHVRQKTPASLPARTPLLQPHDHMLIAIGASTGGTDAILEVVRDFPATMPPVVVVQHMPPVFTNMYAQRLDKICAMQVKEAVNLDRAEPGRILIAPGGKQMRLVRDSRGYYVRVDESPKVNGHAPSVEVLFQSIAQTAGSSAIGVILTGMGADGAQGLLKMRQAGAFTIGQDKDSCVVYGMPQAAFHLGAVRKQVPLDRIRNEIINQLNGRP